MGYYKKLKVENEKYEKLLSGLLDVTYCPCCGQTEKCLLDCTFAEDNPIDHKQMELVRGLLREEK